MSSIRQAVEDSGANNGFNQLGVEELSEDTARFTQ